MREYATPPLDTAPTCANLANDIVAQATDNPDRVLLRQRQGADWLAVTAADFHTQVRMVAGGLIAAGVQAGDRVVLMARTRYEWTLLDYALWYAGAVTVPVYETSSTDQLRWIMEDSQAVAAIGETLAHTARLAEAARPQTHLWTIDEHCVEDLVQQGEQTPVEDIEARRAAVTRTDLATLIYTSGTTGRPKGCGLTHANFDVEVTAALKELSDLFEDGSSTLLVLPLAHVFARVIQVGSIRSGTCLGHSSDVRQMLDDLTGFRPTFLLAVPRVFEKIFNLASQRAVADGHGRIFTRAVDAAIAWSRSQESGRRSLVGGVRRTAYDRLVYGRLREALGGQCVHAISGGAPLGERLAHFYRGIGLDVLEGYGLTETTAALTLNTPQAQKIGTVGRPLPGTSARVADDGELLFQGGQVFSGYWRNPEATTEAIDSEGWFHSGDIGEIDDDGFVRITGRKKEILVTAGGKNVAPTVLEDRIRAHWLVDQCMVVGDGQPFISALVTLDPEAFAHWCELHHHSAPLSALVNDPDLRSEIQNAVNDANRAVSQAESVRKFAIIPGSWTEETGELTASLKLKRTVVMAQYADEVEALYTR